jgi:hypothetical protein
MNFGKRLKRVREEIDAKKQHRHDAKTVKEYRAAGLAKQCMNCKHFVYRTEKPRNWVCRCPDEKMRFAGNTCLGFTFGDHPEMTVINSR